MLDIRRIRGIVYRMRLTEGYEYQVTKPGARLELLRVRVHSGASVSWTWDKIDLPAGAYVTYQGMRPGPGSDSIDQALFSYDESGRGLEGVTGAFVPNSWGTPDDSYLSELSSDPCVSCEIHPRQHDSDVCWFCYQEECRSVFGEDVR